MRFQIDHTPGELHAKLPALIAAVLAKAAEDAPEGAHVCDGACEHTAELTKAARGLKGSEGRLDSMPLRMVRLLTKRAQAEARKLSREMGPALKRALVDPDALRKSDGAKPPRPLTLSEITLIGQLIRDGHVKLAVSLFGRDAVSKEAIDGAKKRGVLRDSDLKRAGITGIIGGGYNLGVQIVGEPEAAQMDPPDEPGPNAARAEGGEPESEADKPEPPASREPAPPPSGPVGTPPSPEAKPVPGAPEAPERKPAAGGAGKPPGAPRPAASPAAPGGKPPAKAKTAPTVGTPDDEIPTWQRAYAAAARRHGAQMVVGLGNKTADAVAGAVMEVDAEQAKKYREAIAESVAEGIEAAKGWKELRGDIGAKALDGDWTRDLDRIAATELQAAVNTGYADTLTAEVGTDALVAVVPDPDACPVCLGDYLEDGRPRIFKLTDLPPSSVNFKRKVAEQVACIPPRHPWCACQLVYVEPGWAFTEDWTMLPGDIVAEMDAEKAAKK